MSLGLSHSLSRYKLKFSPDKVCDYALPSLICLRWVAACRLLPGCRFSQDYTNQVWNPLRQSIFVCLQVDTMIIQAIGLLDDLDKELNTYAMRVREWYGWHFPEMAKVVADNIMYAKVVRALPKCMPDMTKNPHKNKVLPRASQVTDEVWLTSEDVHVSMGCKCGKFGKRGSIVRAAVPLGGGLVGQL
jgi:hypothetical protein